MRFILTSALVGVCVVAHAQDPVQPHGLMKLPPKQSVQQSVTVTADRGLANINDSATSVATLNSQQLQQAPGLTLDDSLHQVAGFQLFRRTSSWTANPTTEGVSLRGLGSTAASRTLVISDQVPLNDPFGGWVHWNEIPVLAISSVNLLRGGSSDLYGSSAIGGVIDVIPSQPIANKYSFAADAFGATENTVGEDLAGVANTHIGSALVAYSGLTTGGYVPTAPAYRGAVDTVSNVSSQSGRITLRTPVHGTLPTAFLRGNLLNEARDNGTPDQTNGTRLWRYTAGADALTHATDLALRLYGSRESYRQSFSSITATRSAETLTKLQRVPTDELGFALQAARAFRPHLTIALGLDLRDIRATDDETATTTTPRLTTSISARQRETGGYADAIFQPRNWSISGSIRVDSFRTFTAQKTLSNSAAVSLLPDVAELFAGPRAGIVRYLPHGLALTATAFRAFRGPTMNELYRTGQVGSQTTLANNTLLAERATGFEVGGELSSSVGHLRATYFWTEVNRPITTVLISQVLSCSNPADPTTCVATSQTLQRENLGQLRSDGLMLEGQSETLHHLSATFGYQLAFATVTRFNTTSALQTPLVGKLLPEVPRQSTTATLNYVHPYIVNAHLIVSYTGHMFDDSANTFVLSPYARFDLSVDRMLPHHLSAFAEAQNLLNRQIEAGKTPTPTLAAPRLVEAGLRYSFNR